MIASYEAIAKRAFEIWEREGRPEGQDQAHWFRAESELRKESLTKQELKASSVSDPSLRGAQTDSMNPPTKRGVRPAQSGAQARSRA